MKFFDTNVRQVFLKHFSVIATFTSLAFIFVDLTKDQKLLAGASFIALFSILYLSCWLYFNFLTKIKISIGGSTVFIVTSDLFKQQGFKVVPFNEYFDTKVDDQIISKNSLNGIYIEQYLDRSIEELDGFINSFRFEDGELLESGVVRNGKPNRYKLGTICVIEDYLLVALSKFDDANRAVLTMPQYLEFLVNFWDSINRVYSQKSVSVPIFGSGITRIKEHKSIADEDLLKIILWTFRISEMRFKYPAKLSIVIHKDKIRSINLLDIKAIARGL